MQYNHGAERVTCSFEGRLDTAKCLEVESEIYNKLNGVKIPVVFDMEKVAYVSSAFLRLCLKIAKEKTSGQFSLTGVCPEVKKVFKIAGFDKIINIQ